MGGSWNRDGVILFSSDATNGIQRISADGGAASAVTAVDTARGEAAHLFPRFLPDGRHFLYYAVSPKPESQGVFVGSLDSKDVKRILNADSMADFGAGYLLFVQQRTLFAQEFDPDNLELRGVASRVADNIRLNRSTGHAAFGVSDNGVLMFGTDENPAGEGIDLTWTDRSGNVTSSLGVADYRGIDLSPDEKSVVFHRHEDAAGGGDVWILDLSRNTPTKFTFDASQDNSAPLWSPVGGRIAFSARRAGKWGLYLKAANNVGGPMEMRLCSRLLSRKHKVTYGSCH
jgi:Tol biopolymer transport system component